jgi:hypothetical protein
MRTSSKHLDELEWTGWPHDQVAIRGNHRRFGHVLHTDILMSRLLMLLALTEN